jgi:hypothetical protein
MVFKHNFIYFINMSFSLNDSPTHFIVLNTIYKNFNTLDKIIKFTKLTKSEVETILKELDSQRLEIKFEKKIFFLGKKMQYKLTDTGLKVLTSKQQELKNKLRQVQQWYSQGDKTQLQTFMGNNRSWMPFLIFSGIMDMVFFMSLMSFMGMTLNPMESSMAGDTGDSSGTGWESETGAGTETGATENVDMQGGDTGGGGFDFDGGGFDSF